MNFVEALLIVAVLGLILLTARSTIRRLHPPSIQSANAWIHGATTPQLAVQQTSAVCRDADELRRAVEEAICGGPKSITIRPIGEDTWEITTRPLL